MKFIQQISYYNHYVLIWTEKLNLDVKSFVCLVPVLLSIVVIIYKHKTSNLHDSKWFPEKLETSPVLLAANTNVLNLVKTSKHKIFPSSLY